jgi:hypothetical protein
MERASLHRCACIVNQQSAPCVGYEKEMRHDESGRVTYTCIAAPSHSESVPNLARFIKQHYGRSLYQALHILGPYPSLPDSTLLYSTCVLLFHRINARPTIRQLPPIRIRSTSALAPSQPWLPVYINPVLSLSRRVCTFRFRFDSQFPFQSCQSYNLILIAIITVQQPMVRSIPCQLKSRP